jgi:hypothetical protein
VFRGRPDVRAFLVLRFSRSPRIQHLIDAPRDRVTRLELHEGGHVDAVALAAGIYIGGGVVLLIVIILILVLLFR